MLQKTVNTKQAFGLVGTFYDDSPRRVAPYNVNKTAGGTAATVGCAFTADTSDVTKAIMGGTGAFLGILVSPKEYIINGLSASLEVQDGTIGQLCTMGHVIVKPTKAVTVGYVAAFNNTTGAIEAYANASSVGEGSTLIPNAKFVFVNALANEPAVLELGN